MDSDRVAAALATLSTKIDNQSEKLEEIKEDNKEIKEDVDSLKQSRSRLRGILAGMGLLSGGAAGHSTGILDKLFG